MPRLVKGGKLVYGWACVGDGGRILIPPEAITEYGLRESEDLILLPGSSSSEGFALGSWQSIHESRVLQDWHLSSRPADHWGKAGEIVEERGRPYCWGSCAREASLFRGKPIEGTGSNAATSCL